MPEVYDFILENIEPREFLPDQYIVREGHEGNYMYILEQGQCEIFVSGGSLRKTEKFVKEISSGSIFGEISLLYGTPRTASVKAKVNCTVGAISLETFSLLITYFPEIKHRFKNFAKNNY